MEETNQRKRLASNGSERSNISSGGSTTTKIGFKTVKGELVGKNSLSINNETYYLLKFLVDNVSKEYYGDASQYHGLKINGVYDISLNYINKKICLGACTESKSVNKNINVLRFLTKNNFEGNDTVSICVRFKYGFKLIDNNDMYKFVCIINYGKSYENSEPYQIECMGKFNNMCSMIKDESSITDEHELLNYFEQCRDKDVILYRVKCYQNQTNSFKNFSIQTISQMKTSDEQQDFDYDENKLVNLSRINKRVVFNRAVKLNAEHVTGQNYDKFVISYETSGNEPIQSVLYNNNNNFQKKNADKNLQRLETDLNQLNDLIENELSSVFIYETVDLSNSNRSVLAITKVDLESETYEGI
ncbi:Late expression factor 3 [Perigonia lusca single nucleopolyhedrovirus]|uniref:Late expression factor 3 n=1 Tax=Perigonia lusca single nucleopolyhedrovirus TaxID=1675865 RepID=A0A0M3WNC4_9ABAC|nr:Late expression factor 3 [Perigonia lusca single nucleopolyhedrovirus]AKN80581.1 Late expression factor 3 [Perigonia lusca single nucleopolyhedrovirus]